MKIEIGNRDGRSESCQFNKAKTCYRIIKHENHKIWRILTLDVE